MVVELSDLLLPGQASNEVGISRESLRRFARDGVVASIELRDARGTVRLFLRPDIEALRAARFVRNAEREVTC